MKRFLLILCILVFSTGCGSNGNQELRGFIQDAFKTRADLVFLYKDKALLKKYFSPQALSQSKEYLQWSPNGQWENAKNLKYTISLRIDNLSVEGKVAKAEVYETVIVTWDYKDPSLVKGTKFIKDDAWSNRQHMVTLGLTPEGNWQIEQDIISK